MTTILKSTVSLEPKQRPHYEYEQDFRYAASRSIPHLGVDFDVDNGGLGLGFDDDSSPSDTDDSELKKKMGGFIFCMLFVSFHAPSAPQLQRFSKL